MDRKISDEDVKRYTAMVESYLRKSVVKNWREASLSKDKQDVSLGNTGWSMRDIRQYLLSEVFVALTKYKPDYRTKEGLSVKESTFVFQHLFNRGGQLLKRLTKRRLGYGTWSFQLEKVLKEINPEE
jgi:hypothetical protein